MDVREQRGLEIAATKQIKRKGPLWIVPSQAGTGTYVVDSTEAEPTCSCPDFESRSKKCKHVYAVEFTMRRETTIEAGTVTDNVRVTYRQEWSAYNAAQTNEKEVVATLLRSLCTAIDNPVQERGRPRLPLADAVFCAAMKVYAGTSARRAMSDIRDFAAKGYIDRAPHYNSVINAFENPDLTAILKALIHESAAPLSAVETDFAADSSGFTTSVHERWFDHKYGREKTKTQWLKAHIMVGTRTNVVTSVEVTDSYVNDGRMFPSLLLNSAKRFGISRVSGDKAYSTKRNLAAADSIGAIPYIPFKTNASARGETKHPAAGLWQRTFFYYMYRREEFLKHYHKRSNVETTFSMIKAKFGSRIRSKTHVAQVNELLCKILCHNLCVLVQSIYELGVAPEFWNAS